MKWLLLAIILLPACVLADEAAFVDDWCPGQIEVVLEDSTRVDCLTDTHAIEADYAYKFYEAIGQSLYYAMHKGKRAGILLIKKKDKDSRYVLRAKGVIGHYGLPIDVWVVK